MFAHMDEVMHSEDVITFAPRPLMNATKPNVSVWQTLAWWPRWA